VKIEPANIGVGLYQHDVKARHLHTSLDAVVESCVNYVGVDVNTASPALLRYVSGLNQTTARNLHEWRAKNGPFTSRRQLLDVPGFGEAAFIQSVGFLKIAGGAEPLDSTWIHPESYEVAGKVLERLGGTPEDLSSRDRAAALADRAAAVDIGTLSAELGVGRLLLADIVEQLARPGRDPREDLPKPFFKKGVLKLEDLQPGMELLGSVLNVVDFGAFVDIGLHDSGLVHVSQLSSQFVRDPHEVVSVGQIVRVWVLEIDKTRRRVALTMIDPAQPRQQGRPGAGRRQQQGEAGGQRDDRDQQGRSRGGRRRPLPTGQSQAQSQPQPHSRSQSQSQEASSRRPPPAGGRRGRGRPQRQEPGPRVYTTKTDKTVKPLTQEMREGRAPLRTFGDLKQFFASREEQEPQAADAPPPPPAAEEGPAPE
jgi:uncharacterized protein